MAPALHLLIAAILKFGEWPTILRGRWIVFLYERKSVYDPGKHKGIHLTPQISKVIENIIVGLFVPQLIHTGPCGRNQFVYIPERGAREALAEFVLTWMQAERLLASTALISQSRNVRRAMFHYILELLRLRVRCLGLVFSPYCRLLSPC